LCWNQCWCAPFAASPNVKQCRSRPANFSTNVLPVRRCCAPKPATAASFVPMVRRSVRRCRAKTATCRAVERLRGVLLSRSRGPQLWPTGEPCQWRTTIHRSCLCSLVHQPSGSTGAIRSMNLRRVRNGYARGKTSGKFALADTRGKRRTCYHIRYHLLFKSY